MADSNITKHALAQALKELLRDRSLEKISVGSICEACGMNRKSFYYHFKDKYDLVNWIYYTEFIDRMKTKTYTASWDVIDDLCEYLFDNKEFYQKTLQMEGQNSFSDYLRDILIAFFMEDLEEAFSKEPSVRPFAEFYADAIICALKKWLVQRDCISPLEFSSFIKKCISGIADHLLYPPETY